jgi:hypothetical protein
MLPPVEEGRAALFEPERRGVHVAIGDRRDLVDFRLLEIAGTGRAERDDEIGQIVDRFEPGQGMGQHHGRLDRADPRHQWLDAGLERRAVFSVDRHHEENGLAAGKARLAEGKRRSHPVTSSRPRITIMVPVMEAMSLAGPSPIA